MRKKGIVLDRGSSAAKRQRHSAIRCYALEQTQANTPEASREGDNRYMEELLSLTPRTLVILLF